MIAMLWLNGEACGGSWARGCETAPHALYASRSPPRENERKGPANRRRPPFKPHKPRSAAKAPFSLHANFRAPCFFPCPSGLPRRQTYRNKKLSLNHFTTMLLVDKHRPRKLEALHVCFILCSACKSSADEWDFSTIKAFLLDSRL